MACNPQPGEARRGKKRAQPYLAVKCPVCGAEPGRNCLLPSWMYAFAHEKRRQEWERVKEKQRCA